MNDILVRSYTEEGYQPIPKIRLDDEAYGKLLQCCAPMCTDIVVVDRKNQLFWLAKRQTKPLDNWWWMGGRTNAQETKEASALRIFLRETGLKLEEKQLELVAILDYRFKDRAQEPKDIGSHTVAHVFAVELTEDECRRASSHLEQKEYDFEKGLVAFNRKEIIDSNLFPAILDLYDHMFPPELEVEFGSLVVGAHDERRTIKEHNFTNGAFQEFNIYNFPKPLGQYYHCDKFEVFYFLSGSGTIRTAKVSREGKIVGEVREFPIKAGDTIWIPPYHTHRFDLSHDTHFVAFSSKPFDKDDMPSCSIEI